MNSRQMSEPENDQRIIPATCLPEGWKWSLYDDGSGGLYSPENKCIVEVDFSTSEYRHEKKWHFLPGYPYETISSGEFMERMERTINSKLNYKSKEKHSVLQALEVHKARIAQAGSDGGRKKDNLSL